jgi:hypothetical protein
MGYYAIANDDYLMHHGVKGQRWGVRRWQNEDGSLTEEGKRKYGTVENFNKAQKRKKIARNVGIGLAGATAVGLGTAAFLNSNAGKKVVGNIKEDIRVRKNIKDLAKKTDMNTNAKRLERLMDINADPNSKFRNKTSRLQEKAITSVLKSQIKQQTNLMQRKAKIEAATEWAGDVGRSKLKDTLVNAKASHAKTIHEDITNKVIRQFGGMAVEAVGGLAASKGRDIVTKYMGEQAGSYMFQNPNKK